MAISIIYKIAQLFPEKNRVLVRDHSFERLNPWNSKPRLESQDRLIY